MLSPIKRRTIRFQSFIMLVLLFSVAAFVTTTSHNAARAQGGKPIQPQGDVWFEIRPGQPRPGMNDPAPPVIRVTAKKNKQAYDTVEAVEGGLRYLIRVRGRCGPEGSKDHLNSAAVKLFSLGKLGGTETFPVDKSHRSMGANHGEGWNYHTLTFPYLHPHTHPVEVCNNELKRREAQGTSDVELLQHGFNVDLPIAYIAELNMTCMEDSGGNFQDVPSLPHKAKTGLTAQVRCMPTGYTPTRGAPSRPGVHLDPLISSVILKPEPAEMKGHACPVYIGFRGQITAGENRPGDDTVKIKYRFVGDRGFTTPFYEETLRKGETKSVFWKRRIEAPPIAGGRNEMAAPGVKPRLPIYNGWTTLEVLYPTADKPISGRSSQRATFTVDCNPEPQRTPPPRRPRLKPNG
jgi:hypothetical protein